VLFPFLFALLFCCASAVLLGDAAMDRDQSQVLLELEL
jgi:hypothetical protein